MTDSSADPRALRIAQFFDKLSADKLAHLHEIYCEDAEFKDPFNAVRGLSSIRAIFLHMYNTLDEPHFVVTNSVTQGAHCFVLWDFKFRFKRFDRGRLQTVRGCSHLLLADDGRIAVHRDYWDTAEELYEKIPVVGAAMRWLKQRANSA